MSWETVTGVTNYLHVAARSTPEALRRLTNQTRVGHLQRLPFDTSFEPLRGPVQHLQEPHDVFSIPDDDVFFLDLLGAAEVLSARELRARYYGLLSAPSRTLTTTTTITTTPLVWLVTNAYTHACRVLLHFSRSDGTAGYSLRACFVSHEELRDATTLHERLLLTLTALADVRDAELRVEGQLPALPLTQFLLSVLGFLHSGGGAVLVRPPLAEMLRGGQVLAAVRRQIDRVMEHQRRVLVGDRPPAPPPGGEQPGGDGDAQAQALVSPVG